MRERERERERDRERERQPPPPLGDAFKKEGEAKATELCQKVKKKVVAYTEQEICESIAACGRGNFEAEEYDHHHNRSRMVTGWLYFTTPGRQGVHFYYIVLPGTPLPPPILPTEEKEEMKVNYSARFQSFFAHSSSSPFCQKSTKRVTLRALAFGLS